MSEEKTKRLERTTELNEVWNDEGVIAVADRLWSEQIEWRDDVTIVAACTDLLPTAQVNLDLRVV